MISPSLLHLKAPLDDHRPPSNKVASRWPMTLKCLWVAYPEFRIHESGESIVFGDGTQMPYPDRSGLDVFKDFEKIAQNVTSLEQMFIIPYPLGFARDLEGNKVVRIPKLNEDPGRLRYEAFFRKLYGDSEPVAATHQVLVDWKVDGSKIKFSQRFGAAEALGKVATELDELVKMRPEFKQYLVSPLGGTFEWRPIAGTSNLSLHSFGIAIDINVDKTDYWRWNLGKDKHVLNFRNRIPTEIVEVFEKHHFIWGGKWSHYDTMHFEYRPELMMAPEECEKRFAALY